MQLRKQVKQKQKECTQLQQRQNKKTKGGKRSKR